MSYVTNFISNIISRNTFKESCTKSGLIPIRVLCACVNLFRFLRIYNTIYTISLLLTNKINRRRLIRFYSQFISKNDLCFDIGANLGSRTEVFLRLGAKVVAVEPQNVCIKKLRKKYNDNKKVFLIPKAVSDKEGEEEIMISNSHIVSSLSREWIENLQSSDMFFISTSAFQWQKIEKVQVTTLDKLIERYGRPDFCKIDVEGYEYNVLRGLSSPIGMISFEFTPTEKFIEKAVMIIDHLSEIGDTQYNYSLGESMTLALKEWIDSKKIKEILKTLPLKTSFSGDIYARFIRT